MLKKIAACVLALSALTTQAAEQAYEFSYTGAILNDVWDATLSTGGKFVVDDLNGDGVFTLPEVKSFTYKFPAEQHCGEERITCTLSSFNYDPNGTLNLWYSYSERHGNGSPPYDGGSISDTIAVEPGFRFWSHAFDLGEGSYTTYHMTDDTKFAISAVPEPHSYLMLGAGLLALGALRRRARRATPATASAA